MLPVSQPLAVRPERRLAWLAMWNSRPYAGGTSNPVTASSRAEGLHWSKEFCQWDGLFSKCNHLLREMAG